RPAPVATWRFHQSPAYHSRRPSAHARPVAVEPLCQEVVEVPLKTLLGVHTEIAQERPGIDAGRVHVVEPDSDRIIADRIDGNNGHIALATNRFALGFGMPLHFGGWAGDPEQFGGEIEAAAVVKGNTQRAAIL